MNLTPSGTHLPVLRTACLHTQGAILELGVGYNSTPYLDIIASQYRRDLWSFDNNADWLAKFSDMRGPNHRFAVVNEWSDAPLERQLWGLAFVDQSPGEQRRIAIERLRYGAVVIVAHDSEIKHMKLYRYDTIYGMFRYRRDYTDLFPHTVLLSNYVDVGAWEIAPWEEV